MDDCLIRLSQYKEQYSPAQQQVARLLLDKPEQMAGLTISQMAAACQVSTATLVRLCKLLGYKGYKEFSLALSLAAASRGQERIAYADLSPGDDLHSILSSVTRHNQAAITDTMAILDEGVLEEVVALLHKARRVDFYGVGMSALVALDAQMKFQRLGKNSQSSFDPHVQAVTAASLAPGDVAVLFSYSGETGDTLDTLAAIRRSGASIVSVTRMGPNRLSRLSDLALQVASSEMLVRTAAMSSRMSMMHLIDLIFSAVATRGYARYKPFLDRTHLEGRAKRRAQRNGKEEGT